MIAGAYFFIFIVFIIAVVLIYQEAKSDKAEKNYIRIIFPALGVILAAMIYVGYMMVTYFK